MPRVNLDIAPGLILDDTDFAVGQGGWTQADKVRFYRGRFQVIGGYEAATNETLDGLCRGLMTWRDNNNTLNHALGTTEELYVLVGGDLFTITPAGLTDGLENSTGGQGYGTGTYSTGTWSRPSTADFTARTWSLAAFGETLLANPSGGTLYQWSNDTNTVAQVISNAPNEITTILVPEQRRHCVAYGCSEETSGNFNARAIRWCDFEDLTDWTTAADNNAGEFILESEGGIVGAVSTAYGEFIWTSTEVWFQTFVGAPGQTYTFTRLGSNCGLAGPNACIAFEGGAYWISPDGGFWTCPAGGTPTRLVTPVEQQVRDELALVQQAKIYAASVSQFREIWWFYPSAETNENDRYVSYQLDGGTWSSGRLGFTAMVDAGTGPSPLAVTPDGQVVYSERGTTFNGAPIEWSVESGDITVVQGDRFALFQDLRADFEDQEGLACLDVITKDYPQGTERVTTSKLVTGVDKVDFRANGRYVRLRFYGSTAPARLRVGRINMMVKVRGRR